MRALVWLFKALWGGTRGSLIGALLLLVAGIATAYSMILPYYNPTIEMNAADLAALSIPPANLQRVLIEGELIDGHQRGEIKNERGYFGILVVDNQLLLVASLEPLPESGSKFLGTFTSRDSAIVDIFDEIKADEDLRGQTVQALFILGEPSDSDLQVSFVLVGIMLLLGMIGILRYIAVRRGNQAGTS